MTKVPTLKAEMLERAKLLVQFVSALSRFLLALAILFK